MVTSGRPTSLQGVARLFLPSRRETMNGYVCFYKGKRLDVEAMSSYEAQQKAVVAFSSGRLAPKGHEINVMLAEINGKQVLHTAN